jgi:hypothetical protein
MHTAAACDENQSRAGRATRSRGGEIRPVNTMRELVDLALRAFIANHERRDIRELTG